MKVYCENSLQYFLKLACRMLVYPPRTNDYTKSRDGDFIKFYEFYEFISNLVMSQNTRLVLLVAHFFRFYFCDPCITRPISIYVAPILTQ